MKSQRKVLIKKYPIKNLIGKYRADQIIINTKTKKQIAWVEEKNQLDHKAIARLREQSDFYGMRMTGYLQIGSGYIAVENILTLSDFLSKITGGSKRVLTNRQVAMMCFLKNHVIRPSNCEEIAKEWGSNSPMAIYNEYTKISRLYSKDITLSVKVAKAYTSDLRVLINTPGLGLSAKKVSEFASIYRLYL